MEARAVITVPDCHLVLVNPIVRLADESALFRADLFEQSDKVMLNTIRIDKHKRSSDSNSERRCCGLARLLDEEVRCHKSQSEG
jgi:hypothetical protein